MARMWTCGFETQDPQKEFGVNSGVIVAGTTPEMSTTVHRLGTCAARFNPTASTSSIEHQLTTGVVMRTFHRLYIRFASFPTVDTNIYVIGQAGYFPATLRALTDGTLILRDTFAGNNLGSASDPLDLDRWYRIELDYTDVAGTLTSGVAPFKGYIDGELFSDVMCANINGFSRIRMGVSGVNSTCDLYMDDVAVNDDTGSVQNGLPGPGNVVHLLPDAQGDNNLWETAVGGTAGAANNWTRVAERTPDDSSSYNQTTASGTTTIDDYGVSSATDAGIGSADLINVVQVGARVGSDNTTAANVVYRLKSQSNGTVLESQSVTVAANFWSVHRGQSPRPYMLTSYTDPEDDSAWTAAKLNNAQIGIRSNVSQTTVRRVSTMWALVDFVPRYALGVAQEVSSASMLETDQSGALTATLQDDFNDNVVDTTKWSNSFGYHVEAGGRGQIGVDTNYNAYSSAKQYKLEGSSITVQVFPPTMNDGASEAWFQVLALTSTVGTDAGWEFRISDGSLVPFVRVGYSDPEAGSITYNAVDHAWVRIREDAGTLYWETSPNAHDWTIRRSVSSPSWVSDTNLELQLIGHRADGTNNYAEIDNFNVVPAQVIEAGLTSVTEDATALQIAHVTSVSATGSTDEANPVTYSRSASAGPASVEDTAEQVTASKLFHLGAASVTEDATAPVVVKSALLGTAAEMSSAEAVTASKLLNLGRAQPVETGSELVASKTAEIGSAESTDDATAPGVLKTYAASAADEVNTAEAVTPSKSANTGQAVAVETANPVVAYKSLVIGRAATEDVSQGLAAAHRYSVPGAYSQATGYPVVARATAYLGAATAQETAQPVQHARTFHLGTAVETLGGHAVTPSKSADLGLAGAIETAGDLNPAKTADLASAASQEAAHGVQASKTFLLGEPPDTLDGANSVEASKRSGLGAAGTTDSATALHVVKSSGLGAASVTSGGQPVGHKRTAHLGLAADQVEALSVVPRKTVHLVTSPERAAAGAVALRKTAYLGRAETSGGGGGISPVKSFALGTASETVSAHEIRQPFQTRLGGTAYVIDEAHPLSISKQRPADTLKPGLSPSSTLTPGETGPKLTAGTEPASTLTVTTTTGG
jgi:hypothetical protein